MITVQEVLDAVSPETPDPDAVAQRILRATATLGREIGYYLGPPKVVQEFFRDNRRAVWLLNDPVPGSEIVVERSGGVNDPWVAIDPTHYVLEGRRLQFGAGAWGRSYRVTYTAGFDPEIDTNQPPQELAALVRQMVLTSLEGGGLLEASRTGVMKSESIGDYSYDRGDVSAAVVALGDSWDSFVKRWRRLLI